MPYLPEPSSPQWAFLQVFRTKMRDSSCPEPLLEPAIHLVRRPMWTSTLYAVHDVYCAPSRRRSRRGLICRPVHQEPCLFRHTGEVPLKPHTPLRARSSGGPITPALMDVILTSSTRLRRAQRYLASNMGVFDGSLRWDVLCSNEPSGRRDGVYKG